MGSHMTHSERIDQYLAEGRTVSGGKGGDEAKAAQKRNEDRQDRAFNFQMQGMTDVKNALQKYLQGNIGFDPQQLAAMTSQFMGQNANDFANARAGVTSMLASRGAGGGQTPVGGDYTRGLSGLFGAEAQSLAGGTNNIRMQNALQALNNKFNAGNLLSGNAAALSSPIATFGSGASNALNQYMQQANSGFGASFMRGFGGALGQGLGGLATGGIGGAASALGGMMNRGGTNLMQGNFGAQNQLASNIWARYTPPMGT